MSKLRHWKQHWDPTATFVFTKRLRLVNGDRTHVEAGDEVTPAIIEAMGRHAQSRLRVWWKAEYIAIKDWQAPEDIRRARALAAAADMPPAASIEPLGKGWYNVMAADGTTTKVRGMEAAQRTLAALQPIADELPTGEPTGEPIADELPDAPPADDGEPGEIVNDGEGGEIIETTEAPKE